MKRTISKALLFVSGAAMLLLAACSKTPEQGKHIPKTAALVLGINSKQIESKLAEDGQAIEKLLSSIQKTDTADVLGKAMRDAVNSGIDMQGDVFITMVPGAAGGQSYVAAYASLKDEAKFEAFIKEKSQKEVKAGTDFKYLESEGTVGFNKNMVIAVFAFNPNGGSTSQATNVETLNGLFHLKAEESIAKVESFQDVQKQKADVNFWMSSEQIYAFNPGSAPGMAAMMSTNIKKLVEGAFQTATLNFEKGRIKVESTSYSNKEMQEIMKKYPMQKVDMSMLEKYPSQNIFGFMLANFDFRMLGDIVKLLGMDGLANMGLAQAGITLDDILKAFKGEIAVIGSDFSVTSVPSEWDTTYKQTKPDAKWLFTVKVGDKAAFEKIMSSPMVGQMFTKQGNEYVPNQPLGPVALSINDQRILAASDVELLSAYEAGKGKATLESGVADKVKGAAMNMYLNVEKLVNNIPAEEMKQLPDSIANDVRGMLKDFIVVTEPGGGKTQKSTMELNFKNESQNAISQIANFTTKMYNYYVAKQAEDRAKWGNMAVDSVVADEVMIDSVAVPAQ